MLSLVEVLNYRCLRYVRQPLERFHVLVGPNASGKTTFLDVASFISDYVSDGLAVALEKRTPNFIDLLFGRKGSTFEFALEIAIPETLLHKAAEFAQGATCRYELVVAVNEVTNEVGIENESVRFRQRKPPNGPSPRLLFPNPIEQPDTLVRIHIIRSGIRSA